MGQIVILCLLICDVLKTHYHFQGIPTQKNPIKLKQRKHQTQIEDYSTI